MLPALKTRESRLKPLTGMVRQMVLGTLLGDASLSWQRDAQHPRLRMRHGPGQADYCRHKAEVLRDYVRTPPRMVPNLGWGRESCVFATVTSPVFASLDSLCFTVKAGRRVKTVTKAWAAELDWPAIAYWYMDDGTMQQRGVAQFSTHSFTETEVRRLAARLDSLGVPAIAEKTRKGARFYWTIRIHSEPTRRFVEKVRPFIHPSMSYKLALPPVAPPRTCIGCEIEIPGGRRRGAMFVSCHRPACVAAKNKAANSHQYQNRRSMASALPA